MTSTHIRSLVRSLCLVPALGLVLASPTSAATKKAKPTPAKKKVAPSPSDKKIPAANQTWEAPPSGDITKAPPPPPAESKPAPEAAAAAPTAAPAETLPAPAVAPAVETPSVAYSPPPSPPLAEEETLPAFVPQPAAPPTQYVEHLGPTAYPGRSRGLYGGSLWLEPSFHGLQWPYMSKTGVGVSGSAWVDTGYESITRESPTVPNTTRYLQQGRAVLRVTPTYVSGSFFIQAQAELVANQCQTTGTACQTAGTFDTDDLWLRLGHWNIWDLKVGRFEGWEVYHTGMGLDVNTLERRGAKQEGNPGLDAPDYYGVNFLHDRPSALGVGYLAAHVYPTRFLRAELLGEFGTDDASKNGRNIWGVRPVAILDLGFLKAKVGFEYDNATNGSQVINSVQDANGNPTLVKASDKYKLTRKGFGGAIQGIWDPFVELGANIAFGYQTHIDPNGSPNDSDSYDTASVGGFLNLRPFCWHPELRNLMLGQGMNWTTRYNSHRVGNENRDFMDHLQIFSAVQYLLLKQLYIKGVFAYARADFRPSGATTDDLNYSNVMYSFRVRLMYLY